MVVWRLKSCPRCGGDSFIDRDIDEGWFEQCLQCGCRRSLSEVLSQVVVRGEADKTEDSDSVL